MNAAATGGRPRQHLARPPFVRSTVNSKGLDNSIV
jgi:hypothetical protein